MSGDFLAIDWGTTNRRVYRLSADGDVLLTEREDRGILAIAPDAFGDEIASIRERYGTLPIVLAGMVGSTRGWIEAPYVSIPAGLSALAANAMPVGDDIVIIPGVSRLGADGRADVMRGEEVQLLGAVETGVVPADALLCQPGTHCKWVWIEQGRITDFVTAITGEVFGLLKNHSLLAAHLTGKVSDNEAFARGLETSRQDDLLSSLFGTRAATLLGTLKAEDAASYVSGLLIGTDVLKRLEGGGTDVQLLADPSLGPLYARAIQTFGGRPHMVDSHAAFVAGITAIRKLIA